MKNIEFEAALTNDEGIIFDRTKINATTYADAYQKLKEWASERGNTYTLMITHNEGLTSKCYRYYTHGSGKNSVKCFLSQDYSDEIFAPNFFN